MHSGTGSFAGIIVAAVEPPYFDKLWRANDLGADGLIALFRSDSVLMMRSPFSDDAMGKKFLDWDMTADPWYATPTYFTVLDYEPSAGPTERGAKGSASRMLAAQHQSAQACPGRETRPAACR